MRSPFRLPEERPPGLTKPPLRLVTATRLDRQHPGDWQWEPFDHPRHRFDPLSGTFRVRYAGSNPRVAARERFPERRIPAGEADSFVVTLTGRIRLLDLTSESVLDALGVDDRVSTGRLPRERAPGQPDPFLDTCGRLADLVAQWWEGDVSAIRYRSCTTPSTTNLAFCRGAAFEATATRLADATELLATLVLGDGFTVPAAWLW